MIPKFGRKHAEHYMEMNPATDIPEEDNTIEVLKLHQEAITLLQEQVKEIYKVIEIQNSTINFLVEK